MADAAGRRGHRLGGVLRLLPNNLLGPASRWIGPVFTRVPSTTLENLAARRVFAGGDDVADVSQRGEVQGAAVELWRAEHAFGIDALTEVEAAARPLLRPSCASTRPWRWPGTPVPAGPTSAVPPGWLASQPTSAGAASIVFRPAAERESRSARTASSDRLARPVLRSIVSGSSCRLDRVAEVAR